MRVLAPAKINLSLRVLGKRADGFHEIETLMVPLELADELDLERSSGGVSFSCDEPGVPADESNLVLRATRLFFERTGFNRGVNLRLAKRIPHGAGLGGGSSDAAATLLGLNDLLRTKMSRERLVEMAAELGSDVPFFLFESAAICRGRGEQIEGRAMPAVPILLLKPPFGIETPWAYNRWADSLSLPGVDYAEQPMPWGALVNNLERPVFQKHLFLANLKQWLRMQPEVTGALLSGSGSTTYAILRDGADAEALGKRARGEFGESLWVCATKTKETRAA